MSKEAVPSPNWGDVIREVAASFWGKPSHVDHQSIRYGNKGSLKINTAGPWAGTWYDFESGKSGGVIDLIVRERGGSKRDAGAWLNAHPLSDFTPAPPKVDAAAKRGAARQADAQRARRSATAKRAWLRGTDPNGSPVRDYLARRMAWAPKGVGDADLPRCSVRWLPADKSPIPLPKDAAGAMMCAFRNAGGRAAAQVRAVSFEALDARGRRVEPRWRRTYGSRGGAVFGLFASKDSGPVERPGPAIALVEGEVSALAARWRYPERDAYALGGTANMKSVTRATLPPDTASVLIDPDGDGPGLKAAASAAGTLSAEGLPEVLVVEREMGSGDVADELEREANRQIASAKRTRRIEAVWGTPGTLAKDPPPRTWSPERPPKPRVNRVLRFDMGGVKRLIAHAKEAPTHRMSFSERARVYGEDKMWEAQPGEEEVAKPALCLVKDRGIYLMSNGIYPEGHARRRPGGRMMVVYADGFDPSRRDPDELWHDSQAIAGGDDFSDDMPWKQVGDLAKTGASTLDIAIGPNHYELSAAPRPRSRDGFAR